jgi:hypothetical protein
MMKKIRGRQAVAVLMGAALATVAVAADVVAPAGTASQSVTTGAPAVANTTSALRAFRDPQTGQLRAPTAEELEAILAEERAMRAATGQREPTGPVAPLSLRKYPNGMRSAVLGPDFLISLKAERTPDGKVVISHDRSGLEHSAATIQRPTE